MNFFNKIDNILAAFGNIKALERTHVDNFTENLITNISGEKIAVSNYGQLWMYFEELAWHQFLETSILSGINIKTFKGGKLIFSGREENLT